MNHTIANSEPKEGAKVSSDKPRRTAKRLGFFLLILPVIGAIAVIKQHRNSSSTSGEKSAESRPVPVYAIEAMAVDVPVYLEGLGNVTPLATVTVRTQVDGRLERVAFKEGQTVKKGELIAQVDSRPFQIQLLNAQAAQSRNSATLQNARVNLERYRTLRGENLVSQQQVDDQLTLVAQTEAALNADSSSIQAAKLQMEFARIVSPINGVTGVRMVDQGNLVRASDPQGIVVITQLDPIAVMFSVPEDNQFRIHQALANGPVTVDVYNRDGGTQLATGQLLVVDNQINTTTSTVRLKASFPNPERRLWPNAFVKARLRLATRKNVVAIPNAAVQQGPQGSFVYVVLGEQVATQRSVVVDFTQGDQAVLSSGVIPGERVIIEGQNQLRPGMKVAVRTPSESEGRAKTSRPGASAVPSQQQNVPTSARGPK